jgi:hypothetical protein
MNRWDRWLFALSAQLLAAALVVVLASGPRPW